MQRSRDDDPRECAADDYLERLEQLYLTSPALQRALARASAHLLSRFVRTGGIAAGRITDRR
jgi:hypothetical protein